MVFQREEQSHFFVVGTHLSLRGHTVMSSQSVPEKKKSMERLGDHTFILCVYMGLGVVAVDTAKAR